MKYPPTVKVFRLHRYDRRNGPTHGRAIYATTISASRVEAIKLVHHRFAMWRGRGERQITLTIEVNQYLALLGVWRFKAQPATMCPDSKTTAKLPKVAGVRHIHNVTYGRLGRDITAQPKLDTPYPYCDLAERELERAAV